MQKFDHYFNVDPGTMNPIQHGEVYVTYDGCETDLDLGHYERFIEKEDVNKKLLDSIEEVKKELIDYINYSFDAKTYIR